MRSPRAEDMSCQEVLRDMDSYLSGELRVETSLEVLRHLDCCPACSAELAARTRVRERLRQAVAKVSVPTDLRAGIQARIKQRQSRTRIGAMRWLVPLAACVALCAVVWRGSRPPVLPALSDRAGQEEYIHRVSATVAAAMRLGLGDHIHCSVFRHYKSPEPIERMERELGPEYQGLLPLVRTAVPDNYNIIMGHRCGYAGRDYIHLTMRGDGKLISLVITLKRPGESLSGLKVSGQPAGIPVYAAPAGSYRVAAFETERYFAFVVSDLDGRASLQIAVLLAPSVSAFLKKTKA